MLYLASLGYGQAMRLRARLYARGILPSRRLPCAVISIGNLTAGGTGKTPMAIHVAGLVQRLGYTVAVISRGYKGKIKKGAAVVGDGREVFLAADIAGDEPVMIARHLNGVPVLAGVDRFAAGMLAIERFHPDVIVCDDAFQHMRLARDIDLVLMDGARPLGNGRLLPRGMLREPVEALRRADALMMTRCDHPMADPDAKSRAWAGGKPVFLTRHDPYVRQIITGHRHVLPDASNDASPSAMAPIKDCKAYAFSGIARNQDFRNGLQEAGCTLVGHAAFADHHLFSGRDLADICSNAIRKGADILVTTEKDYARITNHGSWPLDLAVVDIRIAFMEGSPDLESFIKERLEKCLS